MKNLKFGIIFLIAAVIVVSGCTSPTTESNKTFDKDGISFQYPGNLKEIPIAENDQNATSQGGFQMLTTLIEGNNIKDYNLYVGIGKSNITSDNLQEAADRLYEFYISEESSDYLNVTNVTLKNGYQAILYTYGGTGISSGKSVDSKTYIFTKDNETFYYLDFAVPRGKMEEFNAIIQGILDSTTIQ